MTKKNKDEIIAELKAENERLKKIKDDFFKQAEISHQAVQDKNKIIEKLETVMQEIKAIANNIVYSDDTPACVNDKECPLNGGDGFDDHCNMGCPFILGKQILDLITKAEEE